MAALCGLAGLAAGSVPTQVAAYAEVILGPPQGSSSWSGRVVVPRVLSPADAARYRSIFALQASGAFAAADREIALLRDHILVGHVLADRLLHPRHRSEFDELANWLEIYNEHPQAEAIHRLATKRRPAKSPKPRAPEAPMILVEPDLSEAADPGDGPVALGTKSDRRASGALRQRVRGLLRQKDFTGAERIVEQAGKSAGEKEAARIEVAGAAGDIARHLFHAGDDARVLALVSVDEDGSPVGHWVAGLAAWRSGQIDRARRHFETVARTPEISGWFTSAAAFWASRTHDRSASADQATAWLHVAADHPETFYGQLAKRALGERQVVSGADADIDGLTEITASRRAIALLEIGEPARALDELIALARIAPTWLADGIITLARNTDLRDTVGRITSAIRDAEGAAFDDAVYPMPQWSPIGGFAIDRALIFAIVKQESNFRPNRVSPRGARGPMQILPRTATYIVEKTSLSSRLRDLDDPTVNLTIGQRYVRYLMEQEPIRGNLFMLAVAYNAGIGNLARWLAETKFEDDPLLFIEAIPSAETREFIERVMAAMWVYQRRLGLPTPTLDAIVLGEWPIYASTDDAQRGAVQNAQNR